MEPKIPAQEHGPSATSRNVERPVPTFTPERTLEQRSEHHEQEIGSVAEEVMRAQAVLPPPVALPQSSAPVDDSDSGEGTSVPLVANDDDLIEKEWVDKAKKIVSETKDDPYRREAEVGKLQVEYLRKRYGKELGVSE